MIALVVAAVTVLVAPPPAFAHDELVSSDPAADEALTQAPTAVTLTFGGDLTTGEGATEVQVLDAAGTVVSDGDAATDANTVTQPLAADLPNGAYRVLWKVVSGDGHPTSGEFPFTVEAAAEPSPTEVPSGSATPSPAPTQEATSEPAASATPLPAENAEASSTLPWVLLGVAGVAILAGIAYLLISRARRRRAADALRASQAAALSPDSSAVPPESGPDADR
jgi:methionine-rich copper-binding protein CopC